MLYSSQELIDAAAIEPGKNLFLLDTGAVSRRILEEKLFVDSVSVRRRLPDTIVLDVRESRLLAYFAYAEMLYVPPRYLRVTV